MSAIATSLPHELEQMRTWLHCVFQEASRGLSWQEVLVLRAVEQGLVLGLFGGLLASAWSLEEAHRRRGATVQAIQIEHVREALERLAFGPLMPQALDLLRTVQIRPNALL